MRLRTVSGVYDVTDVVIESKTALNCLLGNWTQTHTSCTEFNKTQFDDSTREKKNHTEIITQKMLDEN